MTQPEIGQLAQAVSRKYGADVLLLNAPIQRPLDSEVISYLETMNRRPAIVLIPVTEGGDPDAAFWIGRALQRYYSRVICLVSGYCKSAGTLIAIAANELVFGPHGELGPIDVQMSKRGELFGTQSGLTVLAALDMMQHRAFETFEHCFVEVQKRAFGKIAVESATEMAVRLSVGLFSNLYGQVDPMHLGEADRASGIAVHYGRRLDEGAGISCHRRSKYSRRRTLHTGSCLTKQRLRGCFGVRHADASESALCDALGERALEPSTEPVLLFVESSAEGDHHD